MSVWYRLPTVIRKYIFDFSPIVMTTTGLELPELFDKETTTYFKSAEYKAKSKGVCVVVTNPTHPEGPSLKMMAWLHSNSDRIKGKSLVFRSGCCLSYLRINAMRTALASIVYAPQKRPRGDGRVPPNVFLGQHLIATIIRQIGFRFQTDDLASFPKMIQIDQPTTASIRYLLGPCQAVVCTQWAYGHDQGHPNGCHRNEDKQCPPSFLCYYHSAELVLFKCVICNNAYHTKCNDNSAMTDNGPICDACLTNGHAIHCGECHILVEKTKMSVCPLCTTLKCYYCFSVLSSTCRSCELPPLSLFPFRLLP